MITNMWFNRNVSEFIGERLCLSVTLTVMAVTFHIMEAVVELSADRSDHLHSECAQLGETSV